MVTVLHIPSPTHKKLVCTSVFPLNRKFDKCVIELSVCTRYKMNHAKLVQQEDNVNTEEGCWSAFIEDVWICMKVIL